MKHVLIDEKGNYAGPVKHDVIRVSELNGKSIFPVTDEQVELLRTNKVRLLPIGFVLNPDDTTFGPASRMAAVLSEALLGTLEVVAGGLSDGARAAYRDEMTARIDARLADVRAAYADESLERCPIVSCHHRPCSSCLAAAMRDFISLPKSP